MGKGEAILPYDAGVNACGSPALVPEAQESRIQALNGNMEPPLPPTPFFLSPFLNTFFHLLKIEGNSLL